MLFEKTFTQFIACFFILLTVHLGENILKILMESN